MYTHKSPTPSTLGFTLYTRFLAGHCEWGGQLQGTIKGAGGNSLEVQFHWPWRSPLSLLRHGQKKKKKHRKTRYSWEQNLSGLKSKMVKLVRMLTQLRVTGRDQGWGWRPTESEKSTVTAHAVGVALASCQALVFLLLLLLGFYLVCWRLFQLTRYLLPSLNCHQLETCSSKFKSDCHENSQFYPLWEWFCLPSWEPSSCLQTVFFCFLFFLPKLRYNQAR